MLEQWNEPDAPVLDQLTSHGSAAADMVAIGFSGTGAERTKASVRAALRMLLANGLIAAVPEDDWPPYVVLDPPGGQPERAPR